MIRCPAVGERYGTSAFDGDELGHHGSENSALKNSAPSSLTSFKTSDKTSIWHCLSEIRCSGQEYRPLDQVFKIHNLYIRLESIEERGDVTMSAALKDTPTTTDFEQ